jgi:hypothetical protein
LGGRKKIFDKKTTTIGLKIKHLSRLEKKFQQTGAGFTIRRTLIRHAF